MQLGQSQQIQAILGHAEIRSALPRVQRGIEREALRITKEGRLSVAMHPEQTLGATLTHPLITTDYAEALLEFITPVSRSVQETLAQLRDVHRVTYGAIGSERLWPLSMPCYVNEVSDIRLAQYGNSHIGRMKRVYRQGLTLRYGAVMQTIAGVHYNFSVNDALWPALAAYYGERNTVDFRSAQYFALIRNFKRFAWVIPYFFGASPILCSSFIRHSDVDLNLQPMGNGLVGLPYATSLRMSDLGYTNREQAELGITYNSLDDYVAGLRRAVFTPSKKFASLGVHENDNWRQLSANILQIENEFYAPIRPKQIANSGETPTQALERGGVEYIEVRSLDVNPFSEVGITETQMRFIDLFLLYCLLSESPELDFEGQVATEKQLSTVVLRGREPGLCLTDSSGVRSLVERLAALFEALLPIAQVLDTGEDSNVYQHALAELKPAINDPEQTLSGQLLKHFNNASCAANNPGMVWADQYRDQLLNSAFEYYSEDDFERMRKESLAKKKDIEEGSKGSFEQFIADYFTQAQIKKMRAE
ncbi:glutamate--cysteine ligase [Aliidiomarina celeris]|uniref:glutamate--cysteine ligase n=1 Tax=Aliidiomarina celeris TaxID=2249428 RepID=UPI000DE9AD94|nr:glutamate--cysteine ligase [Aliidiomarina celeris]